MVNRESSDNEGLLAKPDPTLRFGWRGFSPGFLQSFNTPKGFIVFAFIATLLGQFISTSIRFVAPNSMEKQFGLSSTHIGGLCIAFNLTVGIASLFVGHLCKANKPRWIAIGLVLMSVGAGIISLPKFILGSYEANFSEGAEFCVRDTSTTRQPTPEKNSFVYMNVFSIGFIVHGLGAPSLFTLIPAHIEDVVDRSTSSFYIGIYQSILLALSPALASVIGKPLLSVWVDLYQPRQIEPTDAQWIGAWWLSPLVGAGLLLFWAVPISCYPKVFEGTNEVRSKKHEDDDSVKTKQCFDNDFRSFFSAAKNLVTNRVLILVNLSIALELAATIGLSTFFLKIVHEQFHFTEGDSSLIIGCLAVPGAAVGAFLGGYLVKRYDWNCKQILLFCTAMALVTKLFLSFLLVGCGNGMTAVPTSGAMSCDKECECSFDLYKPICTDDKKTIFHSPCHAGCSRDQAIGEEYFNCSCFASHVVKAADGRCNTEWCPLFPLFAVGFVVSLLVTYLTNAPMLIVSLRVVDAQQRSLALGIRQIVVRFLGNVPGPILFGVVIDASCSLWKNSENDESSNCLEYYDAYMRYYVFACSLVLKLLSFACLVAAYLIYELPSKAENQQDVAISDGTPLLSVASNDEAEIETH